MIEKINKAMGQKEPEKSRVGGPLPAGLSEMPTFEERPEWGKRSGHAKMEKYSSDRRAIKKCGKN